jgi:D-alanine-D-alanine ligase
MSRRDALRDRRLAVLFGGHSGEREVSIASAETVLRGLREGGFEPLPVDTGDDHWWQHLDGVELAFNVQHGGGGEDGATQGLLESLGIVGTGSGVLGSALAMDKLRCKQLWRAVSLPTADFAVVQEAAELEALVERWGAVFVKPAREGSSLGMSRVDNPGQAAAAIKLAHQHDGPVLAERLIDGPEYTVAILGDRTLPPIRIEAAGSFYDYDAKYRADDTRYHIPCGLSARDEEELGALALAAFRAVDCSIWGRVDFMRDTERGFQILEVNTVPGMTSHSLVPMAATAASLSLPDLLEEILWLSWTAAREGEG